MIPAVVVPTITPTTMATMTKKRAGGPGGAASSEVPIFLQKAYHMIDTCDPKICSWSEDGLTFIVKNTSLFENAVIPQFFKHNKFSSFVRQLNFYGFRKVKFSNSLRIDHVLEKETAKWWRFRHQNFRKGRRDLLVEIKRTPSSGGAPPVVNRAAVTPSVASSSNVARMVARQDEKTPQEVTHLKTEMQALKKRMESMTKNIDDLTDLVKKVSVKDQNNVEEGNTNNGGGASTMVSPGSSNKVVKVEPDVGVGNKRKKMDNNANASLIKREEESEDAVMEHLPLLPDWTASSSELAGVDSLILGNDDPLPDFASSLPDLAPSGEFALQNAPSPVPSDDAFVNDLFQAFADEEAILPDLEGLENDAAKDREDQTNPNRPCPMLMKRIEDSLSTIPRDMHEMVANKLMDAISDSKPMAEAASSLDGGVVATVPPPPQTVSDEVDNAPPVVAASVPAIPLPLAVATLKTILSEYGLKVSVDNKKARGRSSSPNCGRDVMDKAEGAFASVPVVPVHA